MKAQKFPVRLHNKQDAIVAIQLPKPMGGSARLFLREIAKNQLGHLYHQPVETGISGRDNSGNEIPINSVGRWLFGTPGYMGHGRVRFLDDKGQEIAFLFPKDSPIVVHQLILEIKKTVEKIC
ncbi:MAG: hypothetical protein KBD14_01570 [Candidatus Pacebacteria bacterium]|nr:hypothetical protein [Candidatus Paceibacterota bacterium]